MNFEMISMFQLYVRFEFTGYNKPIEQISEASFVDFPSMLCVLLRKYESQGQLAT